MPQTLTSTQVAALIEDGDWRVERNLFLQIRDGGQTRSCQTRSWVFRTRFGLQPHSLRAIISVESRKRGLRAELVGRAHYRIAS